MLAIAPTPFFGDYGCHVRILEEVSALAQHGVATTITTYPYGRDLPGVAVRRAWLAPRRRSIAPGSSSRKFALDGALLARTLAVAREVHPHLIHGHLHEGALIGWLVARARRVPLVFDFQGSLTAEMVDHGFLTPRSPAYRGFRILERWIVQRADAIITSTAHGAQVLVQEFHTRPGRVTAVPDGVNVERFAPVGGDEARRARVAALRAALGIPPDRRVVVYLGLLAEYQGTTHLLRAAETLIHEGVNAHFLVMGHPGEERYRILAERLGLAGRVTFTGPVPYEHAPDYLALGDVAVSPKLSLTEGNGKLLNYIAMGLPTVTYDSRVSREILGDFGVYAPPGDWSALAIELEGLLRNPQDAHSRGKALRRKAMTDHQWMDSARTLLGVYERLMRFTGARS